MLDSTSSILCPNCRAIIKILNQIKIDKNTKLIQFNFKFKRVKFKVFIDMNQYKTFTNYLNDLLEIDGLRLKIIYKGKQYDDKMIINNIENNKNNKIEYMIIGSKQSVYSFNTMIKTQSLIHINYIQYKWIYFKLSFISFIDMIRNLTIKDIIQFITFSVTFLFQLIVLYLRSLCNPDIGRNTL